MEEYQKVYIKEDKTAQIQCPSCQITKTIPSEKLPNKFFFIVKCKCGSEFIVQRELRARHRKNVHLTGVVFKVRMEQNSKWGKALNESVDSTLKSNCMIINVSTIGIGIFLTGHSELGELNEGDVLKVQFNLDNSASTTIEKMVTVKAIKNNYLGCEFFDEHKDDKSLKFYLL